MTARAFITALISILAVLPVYADIATADSARARGDYDAAIMEYRNLAQA